MNDCLTIYNKTVEDVDHFYTNPAPPPPSVFGDVVEIKYKPIGDTERYTVWPKDVSSPCVKFKIATDIPEEPGFEYGLSNGYVQPDYTGGTMEYSYDMLEWTEIASGGSILVDYDQEMYLRGQGVSGVHINIYETGTHGTNAPCLLDASGEVLALYNWPDMETYEDVNGNNLFSHAQVRDVSNLIFPTYISKDYQFIQAFDNCIWLKYGPDILPAQSLREGCYKGMFKGTPRIVKAPVLPAMNLAPYCYEEMFSYSQLQYVPNLPAKILAEGCYKGMFYGAYLHGWSGPEESSTFTCSAEVLAPFCFESMFARAPYISSTRLLNSFTKPAYGAFDSMFSGCTNLQYAYLGSYDPSYSSYGRGLFSGCTKLKEIHLPMSIWPNAFTHWVYNVYPNGVFYWGGTLGTELYDEDHVPPGWTVINE